MIGIATATLMTLVNGVSGTPYISGGDSPRGTDCSGLASWVANAATGRPVYGDRFNTGNQEAALLARGFKYGSEPGALVIGWNSGHTAVTLPDGTPVSSGEGGGVRIGGGGAYQKQFTHQMYLPVENGDGGVASEAAPADPFAPAPPPPFDPFAPPPAPGVVDAGFAPVDPNTLPQALPAPGPELLPAPEFGAPPVDPTAPVDPLLPPPAPGMPV